MSNRSQQFPHLPLRFVTEGVASSPPGGARKVSPNTLANRGDVGGHSAKLKNAVSSITSDWHTAQKQREEEGKPDLPNAVSFILHVDPNSFEAEALKTFGIEIVAELEQGYIIGASADIELSQLRQQIERFINGERGGGKIPEIWEILEGTKRPEYILSPKLLAEWDQVLDQQEYIVDIGISCIDIREQYSRCPKRERFKDDIRFIKSVNRWLDKHHLDLEAWDDLYSTRENDLLEFIRPYNGCILRSVAGDELAVSRLPDSFSCRIRILGAGLKNLVLNFPYIFDVSEPDEFAEPLNLPNVINEERPNFELQSPDLTAPRVCVIDSGIEERHPKLRVAIDTQSSRSWVPGETAKTSDYVSGGGHGTKVAGAILYPQGVPRTGKQQAICWIQNARILDAQKFMPQGLFPPDVLQEIVAVYFRQTGTRIFNHSIASIAPCRTQSMSPWAAEIDKLTWENDILFITAAGNIEPRASFVTRPSISDHLQAGRSYPDYLLSPSARIANPAQSFQALTVGSISQKTYRDLSYASIAEQDHPSSFSCSGPGIWDTIKPEVVEYGGDWVIDSGNPPNFTTNEQVCPELVRATLYGGQPISADSVGTSFSTPKVTHIATALESAFPGASCLLYRGLIVQSARLPEWAY